MAKKSENKFSSVEKSWMLYDFTTNGYATIILTAIFPIYFNVVLGQNTLGLELKGYAASFVMLISAIICPFLGAIADVNKMKKRLWAGFALAGAVIVGAMAATSSWELLLAAYVLSNLAYNFAMLFYDSFITDVTDHERMHKVSTWAYAVGYVGGGFVLLVITAVLMFTTSSVIAVKTSFILTALWWVIFSLPMLFNVHQTHFSEKNLSETTHEMLGQLRQTFGAIWANKPLRYFILAYFFYIDGVGTVMTMATSYGNTIGLGTTGMILALLVTQLLGLPFSILFGRLADRLGAYKMIGFAIFWYFLICLVGFYMGISIETTHGTAHTAAIHTGTILFWIMAGMVGMVQGGIQALSRSQFGQMIPRHRSNEYFGFFNIFSRFSSILGPLFMAVVTGLTGKSAFGILSIVILFAIGGLMLWNAYGKREELHA